MLKLNTVDKADYESHQKDLHHQASLYQSTYIIAREEGIEQGKKEGIEQGKKEEKIAMAKIMLSNGLSLVDIAKFTGLTETEIDHMTRQ